MKVELPEKEFDVLLLHVQTKAAIFGDYILAGEGSRYSHLSFILASYGAILESRLAQVHYFVECTAVTKMEQEYFKRWFAVVSWLDYHQCKV